MSTASNVLTPSLNHLLANHIVEYHKLQSFHWYVKGPDFFQVHAQLEELYNGVNETIDELAELILQIGGAPLSSLKEFLAEASIQERASEFTGSNEVFQAVTNDFQALLDETVAVKRTADEVENYLVSAALDGLIASYSKSLWMLRQAR